METSFQNKILEKSAKKLLLAPARKTVMYRWSRRRGTKLWTFIPTLNKMTDYCQLHNTDRPPQELDTSVIMCMKGNCEIFCDILTLCRRVGHLIKYTLVPGHLNTLNVQLHNVLLLTLWLCRLWSGARNCRNC